MARRQGAVVSVQTLPLASGLVLQASPGDTQLAVESVDAFQSFGGTLVVVEDDGEGNETTETVTYGAIDDELDVIYLTTPLQFGYGEGADVIGNGETTMVDVDLEDGEDPVPCELSHALKSSTVLADGQRGDLTDAERVIIDEIAGRWMLVEVIGRRNLIDGGAIDPDTTIPAEAVPDPGPSAPPESSPGIQVVPGQRALSVYAIGEPPDVWTTLIFEVATNPGFTAVIRSIETRSTQVTVTPTPDRTDLYVRCVARNSLGDAPPCPTVGPVRTMLIESVDVADFGLTVKKFYTNTHQLY